MKVIDSHTGGEPTRVILEGGPDLGSGPLAERARRLATEHADFYRSVLLEPRGQPAMVGALLVPPTDPSCATGVIYFDLGAVLGMCGHGTIGLAVTLAHMGRIGLGVSRIETPAGVVEVALSDANTVTVTNVESHRHLADVSVEVPGLGTVTGDVAYGGNWFFLVDPSPLPVTPANIPALTAATIAVREALVRAGVTGTQGAPIDHVIFYGSPGYGVHGYGSPGAGGPAAPGRNFVLCPDDAYDRSPCGTGSSSRLASLAARGALAPGEEIVQHSVIGSAYRLSYTPGAQGGVIPRITGEAHVISEANLIFGPRDPFRDGIDLTAGA